jgi:5-methylthioadenosine/S-adenosylhomocysteine deaminase
MSRYLVLGNPLVSLADEHPVLDDGAIIVEGKTITALGPRAELENRGHFDRVLGSSDHIVMPGFVNGHFHSTAPQAAGLFEHVFERQNTRASRHVIAEDDLRTVVLVAAMNAIRGGQTSVVDFSYGVPSLPDFGNHAILDAYKSIGMRAALGVVTRDQNIYVHGDDGAFLDSLPDDLAARVRESTMGYAWPVESVLAAYRRVHARWDHYDDRIRVILAPDWTPACSDDLYLLNRRLATECASGITSHVLETRSEMLFSIRAYGRTAMRRLADLDVLGPDVSCAHFVWASNEDIQILADTGAVAVNNAGSNLRLSTGIARSRDVLEHGGNLAFGTDGISFSEHEDFFQELRLAAYLQRVPGEIGRGRLDSLQLLKSAARSGAQAVRQEDRIGFLAPGRDADVLVVRKNRIFTPPERYATTPVLDVLLDRANATDIEHVLIAGQVVLDSGRFTTIEEDAVMSDYAGAGRERFWKQSPEAASRRELALAVDPYVLEFYRGWEQSPVEPAFVYNARRSGDDQTPA